MMKYHAHVFFELDQLDKIQELHFRLQQELSNPIVVGRLLYKAVGPLPKPMFQIDFEQSELQQVKQVLAQVCYGFSILIHPILENEYLAHTHYAEWMGQPLKLNLEQL